MSESAADRKARLKALRAKRDGAEGGDAKKLKFRNYLPQSETLADSFEPAAQPAPAPAPEKPAAADSEDDEPAAAPAPAPGAFDEELAKLRADADDVPAIVPRDPNWDLKRDIEPKLAILQKRTQRAIVDILRARLKAEGGG
mmetsp:Transcript_9066/g.27140  ORF Transcript_9066/g.27140 Transcript_9066/m.27140 type:complete len:142 (-) Transcript_9066:34-459(-)